MKLEDLFELADTQGTYITKPKGSGGPPNRSENDNMEDTPPPGKLGEYVTSAQAAKIMGVTMSRIRQFVMDGRLKSYGPEKGRRDHLFKIGDVKKMAKEDRKITGRPPENDDKSDDDNDK